MAKILVKKLCGFMVLAAFLCAGSALWANEGRIKRFAFSFDTVPFFRGIVASDPNFVFGIAAQFEVAVNKNFGILQRADLYVYPDNSVYGGLGLLHFRYYPLSSGMEKLFLDAGIGYNAESTPSKSTKYGFIFSMKAGWKLFLGKFFFLEPALGYLYSRPGVTLGTESGWQLALPFGWAF